MGNHIYNKELSGINGVVLPMSHELTAKSNELHHVFHQYTIRVNNGKRDLLQKHLKEKGIDTMVYYPVPLHKMKVFEGRCKIVGSLKGSENAVKDVLSLPMEPLSNEKDANYVVDCIRNYFGN